MVAAVRRRLRPVVRSLRYVRHRLLPRASYAADAEDIAVQLLVGPVRTFVDVGANDGFTCSNTLLFALRGARGLCFEPDRSNFARLAELYRLQVAVECIAEGISDRASMATLRCDGLLSSLSGDEDPGLESLLAGHRTTGAELSEIELKPLAHWLSHRPPFRSADLLSIDVEGHELSVLRGIDWTATPKPARCVVVETHAQGETGTWRHRHFEAIADLLESKSYREVAASANNTFWLYTEDIVVSRVASARARLPHYTWRSP